MCAFKDELTASGQTGEQWTIILFNSNEKHQMSSTTLINA